MLKYIRLFFPAFLIATAVYAVPGTVAEPEQTEKAQEAPKMTDAQERALRQLVEVSTRATNDWLRLVDRGSYGESWDTGAFTMRMIMDRQEWITTIKGLRQGLGTVSKRELLDIRTAQDPQGVPRGEYLVFVYETTFSGGKKGNEILTLQENNGTWRVMTYVVSAK